MCVWRVEFFFKINKRDSTFIREMRVHDCNKRGVEGGFFFFKISKCDFKFIREMSIHAKLIFYWSKNRATWGLTVYQKIIACGNSEKFFAHAICTLLPIGAIHKRQLPTVIFRRPNSLILWKVLCNYVKI